jgi:hypothetical protein
MAPLYKTHWGLQAMSDATSQTQLARRFRRRNSDYHLDRASLPSRSVASYSSLQ